MTSAVRDRWLIARTRRTMIVREGRYRRCHGGRDRHPPKHLCSSWAWCSDKGVYLWQRRISLRDAPAVRHSATPAWLVRWRGALQGRCASPSGRESRSRLTDCLIDVQQGQYGTSGVDCRVSARRVATVNSGAMCRNTTVDARGAIFSALSSCLQVVVPAQSPLSCPACVGSKAPRTSDRAGPQWPGGGLHHATWYTVYPIRTSCASRHPVLQTGRQSEATSCTMIWGLERELVFSPSPRSRTRR